MSATCLLAWAIYYAPAAFGAALAVGALVALVYSIADDIRRKGWPRTLGELGLYVGIIVAAVGLLRAGAQAHGWATRITTQCPEVHR